MEQAANEMGMAELKPDSGRHRQCAFATGWLLEKLLLLCSKLMCFNIGVR